MHVELHESGTRLIVRLDGEEELEATLEKARAASLVLRLETRLDEGVAVVLDLECGGRRIELPARVRQVFRSGVDLFGTLLEVDLGAGRGPSAGAIDASEPSESGVASDDDDSGAAFTGETLGSSVAFELQRMRPDEKVRLAAKANRAQRQLLLRDRTPQVLLALLNNPWLENAEVLEIAKNPKVVGPVLQRLADDRRFGPNAQVQSALARNPSTPSTVTARLLPILPTRELRELARSQHVREAVRKAALKLYLQRM